MTSEQDYRISLGKIKNLPPLPEASIRIVSTVNDPDVSINEVVEVLSLSPSLVARLLGLANSAYFGYPGQINNLRTAIIQVLGLNLVKSLSLSIALNVQFDAQKCKAFDVNYYWSNALMTAVLAQKLSAKSQGTFQAAIVYTSGLLLDIGVLAAVFLFPARMQEIISRCQQKGLSLKEEMRNVIGVSHYQLGYLLLNRWHLPPIYQAVLKEFESPVYEGEVLPLIELHRICQCMASLINKEFPIEVSKYQKELDLLSIQSDHAIAAIEQVVANKNDIQELAAIICS